MTQPRRKIDGFEPLGADLPARLAAAAPRVLVVGDALLDGWLIGEVHRVAREAPAPVVELRRRFYAPGGAANTALNAAQLGAQVALVSVVGDDLAGRRLRRLLEEGGVDCSALVASAEVVTTTKNRVVAGDQILARLDEGGSHIGALDLAGLAERLPALAPEFDALILCDYGQGLLEGIREALRVVAEGAVRPMILVDAHDPRRWRDLRPDFASPNAAETERMLGEWDSDPVELVRRSRARLLEATGASCVVVTLDREGTIALPGDGFELAIAATGESVPEHRTWANPASERMAAGAGDTFVACLATALASGLDLVVALDLAQAAADVVVHKPGTSVCSTADLEGYLGWSRVRRRGARL